MDKNWNYIDLHAHILPGIDDGAGSMEEAVEMARIAYEEGVRAIIATPHYGIINPGYDPEKAEAVFQMTAREIKKVCPDMLLCRGNELFYSTGILEALQQGKANTLAGSDYVLVEFYPDTSYRELQQGLRTLTTAGYRPILAHAERYQCLNGELELVRELIKQGVYIQINGRNFLRKRFDKKLSWCKKLIKHNLVHFVATDCHNTAGRRPVMAEVVEKLCSFTAAGAVFDLTFRNGIRLMKNEFI